MVNLRLLSDLPYAVNLFSSVECVISSNILFLLKNICSHSFFVTECLTQFLVSFPSSQSNEIGFCGNGTLVTVHNHTIHILSCQIFVLRTHTYEV